MQALEQCYIMIFLTVMGCNCCIYLGTISQLDLVKAVRKGRRSSIAKIFGDNAIRDAVQAFQDMDVDQKGEVTWSHFLKAEEAFVHKPNDRINAPDEVAEDESASKVVSGPQAPPLPK